MDDLKLYIYTRKIAKINHIEQNYELIPKLFYNEDIYNLIKNPNDEKGRNLFNELYIDIITKFKTNHPHPHPIMKLTASNIYYFLFFEYESEYLTKVKTDYLIKEDKDKIWTLIDYVLQDKYNTDDELKLFIEHLMRGHKDMQFGLYFSFTITKNDEHFLQEVSNKSLKQYNPDYDLIYFNKADNFFDYINYQKTHYGFKSPLLYVNNGWDYGKIDKNSVVFDNTIEEFKSKLYYKIYDQTIDPNSAEIICQIPLDFNIFAYFYIGKNVEFNQKYLKYKQKYIKYKQKYLKLKAKIT